MSKFRKLSQEKKEEVAMNVNGQLTINAQMKFVKKVMKWEKCSYDEAWAICTADGMTKDPANKVQYTLGFKMCDPALELALFVQFNKEKRRQAAANFARGLSPEENRVFWTEVFNNKTAKKFGRSLKSAKKDVDLSIDEDSDISGDSNDNGEPDSD